MDGTAIFTLMSSPTQVVFHFTYPPKHGDNRHIILTHQSECEHALLTSNLVDDLPELSNTWSCLLAHTCAFPETLKLRVGNLDYIL
jgi:hypothetical protein